MIDRRIARLATLVLGLALAAPVAAVGPDFDAAMAQRLSGAADGLARADALHRSGHADVAIAARRGLLKQHLDTLDGQPPPQPWTLRSALELGATLPVPGPDSPLAAQWARVFQHITRAQPLPMTPPLPGLPQAATWQALEPGAFAATNGAERSLILLLELQNRSPTTISLPPFALQLRYNSMQLLFECATWPDAPPRGRARPPHDRVPPGDAAAFACTTANARDAAIVGRFVRGDFVNTRLVPRHFDDPAALRNLLDAIAATPVPAAEPLPGLAPEPPKAKRAPAAPADPFYSRTREILGWALPAMLLAVLVFGLQHRRGDKHMAWRRTLAALGGTLLVAGAAAGLCALAVNAIWTHAGLTMAERVLFSMITIAFAVVSAIILLVVLRPGR